MASARPDRGRGVRRRGHDRRGLPRRIDALREAAQVVLPRPHRQAGDRPAVYGRGKTRIPPLTCTSAGEFQDGLALIQVTDPAKGETRYGYIDQTGKYVWQPQA